jgi:aryl-alcohol dehydrogenase-like predicted oxidoreductase
MYSIPANEKLREYRAYYRELVEEIREEVVLASKMHLIQFRLHERCHWFSPKSIKYALDNSLQRMQTD